MLRDKLRWIFFSDMLKDEYRQCLDEGREIEKFSAEIDKVLAIANEEDRNAQAKELLMRMEQAPIKEAFRYSEPVGYEEINASLPAETGECYVYDKALSGDRIRGAWYGRVVACVLGIPVEGWPREKISDYLKATNQWPLADYISSTQDAALCRQFDISEADVTTPYDREQVCWINCLKNKLPNDDDLNYTTIALKVLERYGREFTSDDIAEAWLLGLPALHACTAERAAIRNLLNGVLPPQSAILCNPYREWIGAQIRGDFFGYINPGNPHQAAYMAYCDAAVSHTKNGVYGEMFIAALLSLCFVPELSMIKRIRLALLEIPPQSRLKESLDEVCRWYEESRTFEAAVSEVHARYDEEDMFDWCFTIPNAMLVVICLLWHDTYNEAVAASILVGFDTDCNGATVGSILGLLHGFGSVDSKWYTPFDGNVYTSVHGYHQIPLEELVDRTLAQI